MIETVQSTNWKLQKKTTQKSFKYLEKELDKGTEKPLCLPIPRKIDQSTISCIPRKTDQSTISYIGTTLCIPKKEYSLLILKLLFSFLNPSFLIGLIHLLLNIFLFIIIIYSISHIIYFAKIDISYKIKLAREEAFALIEESTRLYNLNRCDPSTRVPGMERQCREWKCQMENGLSGLKYTRMVVEMLGEALDGFIGKVKMRNIGVIIGFMVIYLIFRSKSK